MKTWKGQKHDKVIRWQGDEVNTDEWIWIKDEQRLTDEQWETRMKKCWKDRENMIKRWKHGKWKGEKWKYVRKTCKKKQLQNVRKVLWKVKKPWKRWRWTTWKRRLEKSENN